MENTEGEQFEPNCAGEQCPSESVSHPPETPSSPSKAVGEGLIETESDTQAQDAAGEQPSESQDTEHQFTPITCPNCESRRFTVIPGNPAQAKCFELDCQTIYLLTDEQVEAEARTSELAGAGRDQQAHSTFVPEGTSQAERKGKGKDKSKPQRRSYAGSKIEMLLEKAEKGQLSLVPPPPLGVLGEAQQLIYEGPDALIRATHQAAKLSAHFGETFEAQWLLKTKWLKSLEVGHRGCERVKYSLRWRPRYLAVLALSGSLMISSKRAMVAHQTVITHQKEDADFMAQCDAAKAHHGQLLLDVCMKSAIEGDCEPIVWQGIVVGHIRKYDSRLRIEMLRAYHPNIFKTPGNNVNVNVDNRKVTIFTPEMAQDVQQRRLMAQQRTAALEGDSNNEKVMTIEELTQGHR